MGGGPASYDLDTAAGTTGSGGGLACKEDEGKTMNTATTRSEECAGERETDVCRFTAHHRSQRAA